MMDPYLNYKPSKVDEEHGVVEEARLVRRSGQVSQELAGQGSWSWWFGNLLIRWGKRMQKDGSRLSQAHRGA